MSNKVMRKTLFVFVWVIFLLTTIVFFTTGPRVEAALFPPVADFQFIDNEKKDGEFFVSGYMDLTRGTSCELQSLTVFTNNPLNNRIITKITHFDMTADETHPEQESDSDDEKYANRSRGIQDFGPWRIIQRDPPVGPVAKIVAVHSCHPFWDIETVIWSGLTEDLFPGLYNPETGELNDI